MSRVQLALNVPDIDEAVAFYSKLFATEPNKRKPGYANFAIADPPLKLVLFEKAGRRQPAQPPRRRGRSPPTRSSPHQARLTDEGSTPIEENGTCCFAKQDKVWVDGPDGAWEIYTVLEDSDSFGAVLGPRRRPAATRCAARRSPKPKPAAADLVGVAMRRYRPCPLGGPSK